MRRSFVLTVGLCALAVGVLIRPRPVIRWLARRYPDVLFYTDAEEPLVALTIDDAPHPTLTPAILDVLAEHGARATFFVIGERVPGNERILSRIVEEGHELGNHLMADSPSVRLSAEEFERQLLCTHNLLSPFGSVRWFRPGSGWYSRRMIEQLGGHGYRCALGSAYAYDCHIRSAWYVSRHILLNTRPGSVIILHDGCEGRWRTVTVLQRVLPELQRRGYRVVTLSELAGRGEIQGAVTNCPQDPRSYVDRTHAERVTLSIPVQRTDCTK
ncbi:MAG: chitin deacetylase family protein [Chloroflexota bacterium]|nr:chitin deacetylase family protein [Chloroflexota bacterium]